MIRFVDETHQYFDGDKELISVTTLMRKHGLAPDYSAVRSDVLQAKAERGSLIHKEIEEYIKNSEVGFTTETTEFIKYVARSGVKIIASEQILHNDIVAGTCDLLLNYGDGVYTIADIKTTSTLHRESVGWQLSIYALLTGNELVKKGQAFHFDPDGNLKVVDVPLKPREEVEKLMQCEREGRIYNREVSLVDDSQLEVMFQAQSIIETADRMKKEADAMMEQVKSAILDAMERNSVKTFENDFLKITYVAPSTRTTIDSAKLKKEMPEVAEKYQKTSETKASLRITLKEQK